MSSAPPIEPFKGTGTWEECDDFIRAIRAAAWKEGKLRDSAWMADLASLHFSRRALVWYSQLPEDVGQDWYKLQSSILTRWAPSEDDDNGAKIEPTPAAAASPIRNSKSDLPPKGILKVVIDNSNIQHYLCKSNMFSMCSLTTDIDKALRVRCNPLSHGVLLERIDDSCHSWLALQWDSKTPDIRNGSTDYTCLSLVDSDTLKSSWVKDTPWQLLKCSVEMNREIKLVWRDGASAIPLFAFSGGTGLYFVPDPEAYSRANPSEEQAKFFIESIE